MERSNAAHLSERRKRPLLSGLFLSLLLSLFFSVLFLLLLSFLLYQTEDPLRFLTPALYITPVLCGFLDGFFLARSHRTGGALIGLLSGAILALLLLVIGLILGDGKLPLSSLLLYGLVLLFSPLGAALAQKKPGRKRRKRR